MPTGLAGRGFDRGGRLSGLFAWADIGGGPDPGLPVVPISGAPNGSSVTPFRGLVGIPESLDGGPPPPRNPFMRRIRATTFTTIRT